MLIGEKKFERPFRWGIVGGGKTSQVGYKHRLGAMRDNTSFVLTAAAFDIDFERGKEFGKNLCMDETRLYPDYQTMFAEEAKRPDGIEAVDIATPNFLHYLGRNSGKLLFTRLGSSNSPFFDFSCMKSLI